MDPQRPSRTRAATAALLSSLFPGIGQLYNREWLKGAAMALLAIVLALTLHGATLGLVRSAVAMSATHAPLARIEQATDWQELALAMGNPAVAARARRTLLPPLLGLCGVVLWSMVDAYRHARS